MSILHYKNNTLMMENTPLHSIATAVGTPVYIYSASAILHQFQRYSQSFSAHPHLVCYAVKANSNLSILRLLARAGAGFDVVSGGELARVLKVGGDPRKIVFSGVGKTEEEIKTAILAGVGCIDIESIPEFERIARLSENLQIIAPLAIRVNPNIDAKTHAHISTGLEANKFGIESDKVLTLAKRIHDMPYTTLMGLAAHIGSQITELAPLLASAHHLLSLANTLNAQGISITHLNLGGGLGITYQQETPPTIEEYADAILAIFKTTPYQLTLEPGRALVGNAGCLVTKIEYLKSTANRQFAIIDAGMNDLIRPALYDASQKILPLTLKKTASISYDIAGPVCESADFLGKNRSLAIEPGDLLAIDGAGAYGFSMSSNYNTRCRPAEVLVEADTFKIIRQRETLDDLINNEVHCLE